MKKYTKLFLLVAFLFISLTTIAQENFQFRPNNKRTIQQQAIEKDIQDFIADNLSKYELTPERIAQIKRDVALEEKLHGHSHGHLLKDMLLEVKKGELRELYYHQNITKIEKDFSIDGQVRYVCDNGGFEDGITDDYTFFYETRNNIVCDMPTLAIPGTSPASQLNTFSSNITLVDNDSFSVNNGFDPVLQSKQIYIPRVNTGTKAIKLNTNAPQSGVSVMRKQFTAHEASISYSYFLILQNPDPSTHPDYRQPHFMVRLYNSQNVIIDSQCIIADVNDTLTFNSVQHQNLPLLYTGWQCATLNAAEAEPNETLTIEFIITDCGLGAHYGTVYIDDICSGQGCEPVFGDVQLNLNEIVANCPTLPLNICGTYNLPRSINTDPVIYGTLEDIKLNIFQNGILAGEVPMAAATITDSTFCFQLDATHFYNPPSGNYDYEVDASFEISNVTYFANDATLQSPDMMFNGCVTTPPCVDYLLVSDPVLSSNEEEREANVQVIAENVVNPGAIVYYHGGEEVILREGFDGLYESTGHYYITGCDSNSGVARPAVTTPQEPISRTNTIDLVEVVQKGHQNLNIFPNPASNELNIVAGAGKIRSLNLVSLDGKLVLNQESGTENHKLDISSLAKGIYLLTVEMENGEVTSHKVVKE